MLDGTTGFFAAFFSANGLGSLVLIYADDTGGICVYSLL